MVASGAFGVRGAVMRREGYRGSGLVRPFLLGTTSLSALLFSLGAEAACVDAGDTRTCTGNLVGGVVVQGPFPPTGILNLVVNGLTANIAPASGPAVGLLRTALLGTGPNLRLDVAANPFLIAGLPVPGAPPTFLGTVIGESRGGLNGAGGSVTILTQGDFNWLSSSAAAIFGRSIGGAGTATDFLGGTGGAVDIRAGVGRIETIAPNAAGVAGLSQGGRGAAGGGGDEGGNAGAGGTVLVSNAALLITRGRGAVGVLAQSRGGFGGAGGDDNFTGSAGDGGSGGAGGSATATNAPTGRIRTAGLGAHGMMAISVGGGGGAGGDAGGLVGLGGGGGSGGAGFLANTTNRGDIRTTGDLAAGVIALSVGGGGGDGGSARGLVSLGGAGATTSAGGTAIARNQGTITTAGGFAQGINVASIGGGGGRGGTSSGVVTIGGEGGGGGLGGLARVEQAGSVTTSGLNAQGILLQSIGGGGGAGGDATAVGLGISVAVGGAGGAGGNGGRVELNADPARIPAGATPSVTTSGANAIGILAQSVGGGGGTAGRAMAISASALPGTINASFAIGGSGGNGGAGGVVDSRYAGSVATSGALATGLLLQSVGGGGGTAGNAVSISGSVLALDVGLAMGGTGGGGGSGGTVGFDGAAAITTQGDNAVGLLAQSVGGGGGAGGHATSLASGSVASATIGLGGSGGVGGRGGSVSVRNAASILTQGTLSHGIHAQSIGGGGGTGGEAFSAGVSIVGSVGVALGGQGGAGTQGGSVTVNQPAVGSGFAIATQGQMAHGVLAQSIGGGGGAGGAAGLYNISGLANLGVALGGSGGIGAIGGTVAVTLDGDVSTQGDQSYGVLAQSVGGGGGTGGVVAGGAMSAGALNVTLGGSGGIGGRGGDVTVTGGGDVATRGQGALGVMAQSVGGGGGMAGIADSGAVGIAVALNVAVGGTGGTGGHGGSAIIERSGNVTTGARLESGARIGAFAPAVMAQSIGGGGGMAGGARGGAGALGGLAAGISLGGDGGAAGNGGLARVTNAGDAVTFGDFAAAVFAQSVGGGGGLAGQSVGVSVAPVGLSVAIGGDGGSAGNGGTAEVTQTGLARTHGDHAPAVMAQSIGGGGGAGGQANGGSISGGSIQTVLGGGGASGGFGGTARATLSGSAITEGTLSFGVLAQSVGGGGGTGGYSQAAAGGAATVTVALGGTAGLGGNGGLAEVISTGTIATTGNVALGAVAQSIGGGGGIGGDAFTFTVAIPIAVPVGAQGGLGGAGGVASLRHDGIVTTSGDHATALLAQSIGGGGGYAGTGEFFAVVSDGDEVAEVSVPVGARGGAGGSGGIVTLSGTGTVATSGVLAAGVVAQSIGGGGGIGGSASALSTGTGDVGVSLSFGGAGGAGGNGGLVTLDLGMAVGTTGTLAPAILAQSIGGGGGAGGSATGGNSSYLALNIAMGGNGGVGGTGGAVSLTSRGAVGATGALSQAILAQSIGGGGGTAGSSGIEPDALGDMNVALGATGGAGGGGGSVVVVRGFDGVVPAANLASIQSLANYRLPAGVATLQALGTGATGLLAQSIGGGGGASFVERTVGLSAAGIVAPDAVGNWVVGLGAGSATGRGGAVTLRIADNILTGSAPPTGDAANPLRLAGLSPEGGSARGVVAQSVGGGGGVMAGAAIASLGTLATSREPLTIRLGTNAALSDRGDAVSVTVAGAVETRGFASDAIVAQSIGGGGGIATTAASGAFDGQAGLQARVLLGATSVQSAAGFTSTLAVQGSVATAGNAARGLVAQSIGAGGGIASMPIAAALGGPFSLAADAELRLGAVGATTSNGGTVSLRTLSAPGESSQVTTQGRAAHAVLAQSIGGGGGVAELPLLATIAAAATRTDYSIRTTLGTGAGSGLQGGTVILNNGALIATAGADAIGLAAQSIGAGGGLADASLGLFLRTADTRNRLVAITQRLGTDEAVGAGGTVTLVNRGAVGTLGRGAHGVLAQSIGGGGGVLGGGLAVPIGRAAGDPAGPGAARHRVELDVLLGATGGDGDGGAVSLDNRAAVTTAGEAGFGLAAQSIGAGGGIGPLGRPAETWLFDSAIGLTASLDPTDRAAIAFRQRVELGAREGSIGAGGAVTLSTTGAVATAGANAVAVLAQSIGNGGGVAGLGMRDVAGRTALGGQGGGGGIGGTVRVTADADLATTGALAHALLAQSIGGGGGLAAGGLDQVTLGAESGFGGGGGLVEITGGARIQTSGALALGAVGQSIGAGGGLVGALGTGVAQEPGGRSARLGAGGAVRGSGGSVNMTWGDGSVRATTGLGAIATIAQSIGGGGGIALLHRPEGTAAEGAQRPRITLGAQGAALGAGGAVTVTAGGTTVTEGEAAHGLIAQSIGAGGGTAIGFGLFSLGASGAESGVGGSAQATLGGPGITTLGAGAFGAVVQSIGGGGGFAQALLQPGQATAPQAESRALGGATLLAAGADTAALTLGGATTQIATGGVGAPGAVVQSIGGGGGISVGPVSAQGSLTLGGGGAAGNAGTARFTALGAGALIITAAADAPGLVVQSIGGGGGYATGALGALRLGGTSPQAAAPGRAELRLAGRVDTMGTRSPAVLAQSIAAGGGAALFTNGTARLGAFNGADAAGGAVELRQNAELVTRDAGNPTLLMQSIAGGGGFLASAAGEAVLGTEPLSLAGGLGLAAASGPGGAVWLCRTQTVTATGGTPCTRLAAEPAATTAGLIVAVGASSAALVAQSIAGGGGVLATGGAQVALGSVAPGAGGEVRVREPGELYALGADSAAAVVHSIGGGGGLVLRAGGAATLGGTAGGALVVGQASPGGIVEMTTTAPVFSSGPGSLGLVAQSIGGGGGTVLTGGGNGTLGGTRGGAGGTVTLRANAVEASGAALVAQSIGGGGGLAGRIAGEALLGGGTAGAAQAVFLETTGAVTTTAAFAPALLAQSIGGGGGAVLGGVTLGTLGGGAGGSGGTVDVATLSGTIATSGAGAVGILAQSIGGGGGVLGGVAGRVVAGGTGTTAGNAGDVGVKNNAAITTAGEMAHGILAQSLGGGGGVVLGNRPGASTPLRAASGNGGDVIVDNTAPITVSGANAHGIVAQSIGGGGVFAGEGTPIAGAAGSGRSTTANGLGAADSIFIRNRALVQAGGAGGIGIFAQTQGGLANANARITLELDPGSAVLGGAGGAALRLQTRAAQIDVMNRGIIGNAIGGRAVLVENGSGTLNLTNEGTLTGNVDAPLASILNSGSGLVNAGPRIALGTGSFTNNGGFAVAGQGVRGVTQLTGFFSNAGTMHVDVEGLAGGGIAVDRLEVSRVATLGGRVAPALLPGTTIQPGTHTAVFLNAAQGITVNAPQLVPPPTINATWSLVYPTTKDAALRVTLSTTAMGAPMAQNQLSVAQALARGATSNPAGFATVSDAIYGATNVASYTQSLSSVGGDGGTAGLLAAQGAMGQFMMGMTARLDLLQRSGRNGMVTPASFAPFALASSFAEESHIGTGEALLGMDSLADVLPSPTRFWAMPLGFGAGTTGSEARLGGVMLGMDHRFNEEWTIGAVGGWSSGSFDSGSAIEARRFSGGHAGAYALWERGGFYLSGQLGYARHEGVQARSIAGPGSLEFARADIGYQTAAGQMELGYRHDLGAFMLTPFAGIGLRGWQQDGANETSRTSTGAAGVYGLRQDERSGWSAPVSLGMRAETSWRVGEGLLLDGHLRAAWVRQEGATPTSRASMALAPAETFTLTGAPLNRDSLAFQAGVQLQANERLGFGVVVLGDVGDRTQSIGGFGRIVYRW